MFDEARVLLQVLHRTPAYHTHTLLKCTNPFSVETKSCTTQQELSPSGVSAPHMWDLWDSCILLYLSFTCTHTHTPNTHIPYTHRATFTRHGLTGRRILIRLHPKLPPTGSEGDMNLKRQCSADMKLQHCWATGTPVKTCYPETCQREREGGGRSAWKLNVQQPRSLIKQALHHAHTHTHTPGPDYSHT